MMFTADQKKLLSEKLNTVNVRPASANGPKGDYLEGWHVMAEANRIFGFDGWSYQIIELKECHDPYQNDKKNWVVSFIARIRVDVAGVTREDVGYGSGFARNVGDAYESATKECTTDALKRCLRSFGNIFGLALYDKSRANVESEDDKRNEQAMNNLWGELTSLTTMAGLKSFWDDNYTTIQNMSNPNRDKFTAEKDKLKSKFSSASDTVKDIQDTFPGARVISDITREQHPLDAG